MSFGPVILKAGFKARGKTWVKKGIGILLCTVDVSEIMLDVLYIFPYLPITIDL